MRHSVPQWYRDAKLGILVRWGVPSVPAYAPSEYGGPLEILRSHNGRFYFQNHPDAQWYLNSLRIGDSPVHRYHRKHYGGYTAYERFARRFNEELPHWDPTRWADQFREAGARYVVMTAKHHDGFLLWPTEVSPVSPAFVAQRDVVGELAKAVRALGMRYGVSYSGLLDWTVQTRPIRDFADVRLAKCPGDYPDYVAAHLTELIGRTAADVLRLEGGVPRGLARSIPRAYRETVADGVLQGSWRQSPELGRAILGSPPGRRLLSGRIRAAMLASPRAGRRPFFTGDVPTVEYPAPVARRTNPWEYVRGLGRSSGYNASEPAGSYLTGVDLVHLLADVVSKNGNLLLSVAPALDGSLCPEQREPLAVLARWLATHREAIYGTRPWRRPEGTTADGLPVRFTARANTLYAIVLGRPRMLSIEFPDLDLDRIPRSEATADDEFEVRVLGLERSVSWHEEGRGVVIDLPGSFVPQEAIVVEFAWRTAAGRRASSFFTDLV